jgi:hypothetical protein
MPSLKDPSLHDVMFVGAGTIQVELASYIYLKNYIKGLLIAHVRGFNGQIVYSTVSVI